MYVRFAEQSGAFSGGGGERGILNHRGRGQARWAFRAWESGGDGIYCTHMLQAVGVKAGTPVQLATTEARLMPD